MTVYDLDLSDAKFDIMGWHDSRVYSLILPKDDCSLTIDLDYIFQWHQRDGQFVGFDVAPCLLTFHNISGLKIALDYANRGSAYISDIHRKGPKPAPKAGVELWEYEIELDSGTISFTATGYTQSVTGPIVFSESQDLGR
ncbi:hypothetical protein [Rhizobium herbae]|uniref:Uncharacterized protein n=1 Tax=Rhizobium herbae TaxID=508661 RepID=A0ABS4ESX5_9HYPH|nr:hypothetical protein [Rhizobium herbae]MBP1861056.1 hypothetical protein [Rhizobium herbae]